MLQSHRQTSGSTVSPSRTASIGSKPSLARKESSASSAYTPRAVAAPPPYQPSTATSATSPITKKAPPPPPPLKPKPSYGAKYCTAIFDFDAQVSFHLLSFWIIFTSFIPIIVSLRNTKSTNGGTTITDAPSQAEGDLSFRAGDRIELIERTENPDDWWTGRLNGQQGIFPGTYTQVE